ncbi:glycosyltransferase [Miltoncostaea oceani]|uniref:glycosyltransferase n=1 Tax=Miltoncostaea oceani TaxID=2843216 RepID=UPI001C3D6C78|nr:glycosyltransferase [Miltoncostaea oceani]
MSVLLTTYQHERFIADALEGVVAQRLDGPWEVIVGDDASTDRNREIIRDYARRYPDLIHTHFPERNLGHGGRPIFAQMVERARGDHLAVLDGDDYWTDPRKLARQSAYLDAHPGCAMCFHDVVIHWEDGSAPDSRSTRRWEPRRFGLRHLLGSVNIAACSPMFRRTALAPLPEWYRDVIWGDWQLYVLAAQHGWIGYLPDAMAVYRVNDGGVTWADDGSVVERARRVVRFHGELAGRFDARLDRVFARSRSKALFELAAAQAAAGDDGGARDSLARSLRAYGPRLRPRDARRLLLRRSIGRGPHR